MNAPKIKQKTEEVLSELKKRGILMCHDWDLPSATSIIANEKIKGSWWPHTEGSVIYHVLGNIFDSKDIIAPKLINEKITLLYKDLFPYFYCVVRNPQNWQLETLKDDALSLFELINKAGSIRSSDIFDWRGNRKIGEVVRDLEKKLLVYCMEVHTETGAHAKTIYSWKNFFSEHNLPAIEYDEAQATFECFAFSLGDKVKLPWF